MIYTMRLKSVGNPDYQQYAPISEPETVTGASIKEMSRKAEEYQEKWNLGGGNWVDPILYEESTPIGRFSYNLRLWSLKTSAMNARGTEILY